MNIGGGALIIAAALIAGGLAISHRYSLTSDRCIGDDPRCSHAWLVDQWTGTVVFCEYAAPKVILTADMVGCHDVKTH